MDMGENMFDNWLKQEKDSIRENSKKFRAISVLLIVLMLLLFLPTLVFLLDGDIMFAVVMLAQIAGYGVVIFSISYKRRLIKPLLASIKKELPTDGERQEFARQMRSAMTLGYAPAPQAQTCEMYAGTDYCYYRQPFKSRIIRNRDVKKAVLDQYRYFIGRWHVRYCYVLKLFTAENEKTPVWTAYYPAEGEAYAVLSRLRGVLPEGMELCDHLAYYKTEQGEKEQSKKHLIEFIKIVVILVILIILVKLRRG